MSGTFVTALNGPGFGITLVNASKATPDIFKYFDLPTTASGWNVSYHNAKDWEVLADGKVPTAPALEHTRNEKHSGLPLTLSMNLSQRQLGTIRLQEMVIVEQPL
ncbi:hypothetical protein POMI540_4781 [Schizosaccharomyces pombe]